MRKTFSITDDAVLEHLEKQKNKSKYLEQLILADMNKTEENNKNIENIIEKVLEKYLSVSNTGIGGQIAVNKPFKSNQKVKKSAVNLLK